MNNREAFKAIKKRMIMNTVKSLLVTWDKLTRCKESKNNLKPSKSNIIYQHKKGSVVVQYLHHIKTIILSSDYIRGRNKSKKKVLITKK